SLRRTCPGTVPFNRTCERARPIVDEGSRAPRPVHGRRRCDLCRRDPWIKAENPVEVAGGQSLERPLPGEASDVDAVGGRRREVVADIPIADREGGRWRRRFL